MFDVGILRMGNLLAPLPPAGAEEVVTALAAGELSAGDSASLPALANPAKSVGAATDGRSPRRFWLQRIVSHGQATPPGEWYDQAEDEWVALLAGSAGLRIEGLPTPLELKPGDHLRLPAGLRHRVEWTSADPPAVWLALHYPPSFGADKA